MNKKKNSAVGVLVSFLRGIIILALALVLVCSVTINIAFHNIDKPVDLNIDLPFYKNHTTYFINNSGDLQEIQKGSLVIINPELTPAAGRYVLCTIGKNYKTILAITEASVNENGTVSYVLKGTKQGSTINYTLPAYKIHGVVTQQNEDLGYLINFMRNMSGVVALVAIPSFLLILICVISIKANKSKYEDDLLESEILIEELRNIKKIENKKNKTHAVQEQEKEQISENNSDAEKLYGDEIKQQAAANEKTFEDFSFEEEMNKKAIAIKNAMHNQIMSENNNKTRADQNENSSANEIVNQMPSKPVSSSETHAAQEKFENYASLRNQAVEKGYEKTETTEDRDYQQQIAQLQAKQQQMAKLSQTQPAKEPFEQPVQRQSSSYAYESPNPQTFAQQTYFSQQPEEKTVPSYSEPVSQRYSQPANYYQSSPAPVKKKTKKRSVQKINADSFDDLIKMLDNEKKKLD